jgi:hypothetical protein
MFRWSHHGSTSSIKSCKLIPSVFHAIYDSLDLGHSHRPLLQNLRELVCEEYLDQIPTRTACMFLGPRLKKLAFSIPYPTISLEAFLAAVKSSCPSLEILCVEDKHHSEEVGGAVSNLVSGLSCLRDLLISDVVLNCKAFVHLASLPSLQELYVSLPALRTSHEIFPVVPFPALKHFHAHAASIADVEKCVLSSLNLESISIDVSITPPSHELHTFFTTVHQSCSRDTLTSVTLQDSAARDASVTSPQCLEAHTLMPLLQCPNLEVVSISIRYTQEAVDNALIKDIALAWPRLRQFTLDSRMDWRSSVNLEGLLHLAQHCRALISVNLQFDVSLPINRTDSERLSSEICNDSVVYLFVRLSPIVDPPAVASFLSNVYPNLRLRHSWYSNRTFGPDWSVYDGPEFTEMSKRWEELDRLLTIFANNRK